MTFLLVNRNPNPHPRTYDIKDRDQILLLLCELNFELGFLPLYFYIFLIKFHHMDNLTTYGPVFLFC